MALTRYQDEFVPHEVDERFGRYLTSYASEHRRVEVHLFRTTDGTLGVYITKSSGVPVPEAHAVATEALNAFQAGHAAVEPHRFVYDGYSIGRSGSI